MTVGTTSSNTSTTQTSPTSVADYWKTAIYNIGNALGFNTSGTGTTGTGTGTGTNGSGTNSTNQYGLSDQVSYTSDGLTSDYWGNPYSSTGGTGTDTGSGDSGGGLTYSPSELASSEFVSPSTPMAEWVDYPGLESAKGMLSSVYPDWERLSDGDYNALESALYGSATAGLETAKSNDTTKFWGEAANRGLGDDPSAQLLYGESVLTPYNNAVEKAGYDSAVGRYNLESADLNSYNTGTTGRVNEINDQLTARTNAQNSFNQWQTTAGDSRASQENSFNLNSDNQENTYDYQTWATNLQNIANLLSTWYKGLGSNSSGSSDGLTLGTGVNSVTYK